MVRFWARLTLLQRYTFVSAAIAVGLTVLISELTVQAIESFAVRDEAQVAAEFVLRTVEPQLRQEDLKSALPPRRVAFFNSLFRARGISDRVLRIRLWRADGRLLYSNVSEPVPPDTPGVDFSTTEGFGAFERARERVEPPTPGVLRFFVPITVAGNPQPVAGFEIFYDLSHLQQQLQHTKRTVRTAVPLGIFVLYASVFVLVRRASQRLLKQQEDLIAAHLGTYQSLASAIDAKDSYTGDHSTNVANLAARVARALRLPADVVDDVRIAARLHDLGKIGVPDAILMKPGPLTADEWEVMRQHAQGGFEILEKAPLSARVKLAVRYSHERWDGRGYPDGLAAEAIPLIARIVAVVDAYEAMTSDRPYRKALPPPEALARLEHDAGAHLDPKIVQPFVHMMRDAGLRAAPRASVPSPR